MLGICVVRYRAVGEQEAEVERKMFFRTMYSSLCGKRARRIELLLGDSKKTSFLYQYESHDSVPSQQRLSMTTIK
jgi:hypothetical protein